MLDCAQLLLPWLMWTGSVLLFWLLARGLRLRHAMATWPRVRGVVREHVVRTPSNLHGPGRHRPNFIVEYVAQGRTYTVQCDSPTRLGSADVRHARAVLNRFRVGKRVALYVDPRRPSRAFLYPPENSALLLLSLAALFLLLVGVGMSSGAKAAACWA